MANAARMYDYYLGGSANFDVDRQAVHDILLVMPEMQASARMNRRFLRRAVQFLLRCGVRQFLDLGSGVPTVGNVHEIALAVDPSCRVAYVDHDPVAVAHGRRLLSGYEHVTVTEADIRDPQQVLSAPGCPDCSISPNPWRC